MKRIVLLSLLLALCAAPASAQGFLDRLSKKVDQVSKKIDKALGAGETNAKTEQAEALSATTEQTATSAEPSKFTLTKEGVGPLKIGMPAASIPAKVAGLYDRMETMVEPYDYDNPDAGSWTQYRFYSGNEWVLSAQSDNKGNRALHTIEVLSPAIATPEGVYNGMPMSEVLKMQGLSVDFDHYSSPEILLNGIIINANGQLTEKGEKVMYDYSGKYKGSKISADWFIPGAKAQNPKYTNRTL
jgi:hypothetical protein